MIRIGVLGPADIARRRMVPAIIKNEGCEYAGVALATMAEHDPAGIGSDGIKDTTREKGKSFLDEFGGRIYEGYNTMLSSDDIDAVYIALPPALHHKWAGLALKAGKHVLLEKPFTTKQEDTKELIDIASDRNLAVAEDFGFIYHKQMSVIKDIIASGRLGDLRLIRANFGFPFRGAGDFRYHKALGGGALLDCGCYTLMLASDLLEDLELKDAALCGKDGFDVDIYGTISAEGRDALGNKVSAQLSFGMDQQYCCGLEVWGSKGCLKTDRIFTAPPQLGTKVTVTCGMDSEDISCGEDDQFGRILDAFLDMIADADKRKRSYEVISTQADLMQKTLVLNDR